MARVDITGLEKRFGRTPVLDGINLSIVDGEFLVLVGPSGCGKSTLLRLLAGLDAATAGQLWIGERDVTHLAAADRRVAMVFQNYALYPHMSARDNLTFGMRMRGEPRDVIQAKLERAIRILDLGGLLDRKPGELSGGQCQRVAIGRALVQEPQVFLFDEPLSNLDAELRMRMRLEIAALHRELGTTMVYVTHDQHEAMTLADRIVVMKAGRIEQVGSPMALYSEPANTFVAGFIGSPAMNLLPAQVHQGQVVLMPPEGRGSGWALTGWTLPDVGPEGQSLTVGVRPEHLEVHPQGPIPMAVDFVERLGPHAYAHGHLPGIEARLCVEVSPDWPVRPGESMNLGVVLGRAHLFDTQGQRMKVQM